MRVFFFSVERVLLNERASVGLSVSSLCPVKVVFKHSTYLHTHQI